MHRGGVQASLWATVIGLGAWLRISSLASMPIPDGDETWFALMSARMARGLPFETRTPTGNPMVLLQAPIQVPLIWAFGPELWIVRSASAAAGLLAIVLLGWPFSRVLDRATALIAAGVLASMPAAIAASRTGYDVCLLPLFGALMLSSAFRLRAAGVVAFLGLGYLAHPTAVFALPTALAVFAARWRRPADGGPTLPWRGLAARAGLIASAGAMMAFITSRRAGAQAVLENYHIGLDGPHDPIRFLTLCNRYLLAIGREVMPARESICAAAMMAVAAAGLVALIRRGQWDRVALVAGTAASAGALFVVSGSEVLQPGMGRNGHCLLAPAALSLACLLRASLPDPAIGWRVNLRRAQLAAMAVGGLALILSFDVAALDDSKCQDADHGVSPSAESIWTFRADGEDYRVSALRATLGDRPPAPGDRLDIVCDGWNTYWPIAYLCLDRDDVRPIDFDARGDLTPGVLREGGAVVAAPGGRAERWIRGVLPGTALLRDDLAIDGVRIASVYRRASTLADARPGPGDFDGDGRLDLASYDPDSGHWTILGGGGPPTELIGPADGIPAPGDYSGDGRDEPAVYLPGTGAWSLAGPGGPSLMAMRPIPWGVPVPGDYLGEGRDEPAVFDPARAVFHFDDPGRDVAFGQGSDYGGEPIPSPGDFDGDGRLDLAVYQADSGTWLLLRSAEGAAAIPSGIPGGLPFAGDFTGDGKDDLVVYRPDSGAWDLLPTSGGGPIRLAEAPTGQVAVGDVDGDGRPDLLVFDGRSGEWSGPLSNGGRLAQPIDPPPIRRVAAGTTRPGVPGDPTPTDQGQVLPAVGARGGQAGAVR